MPVVEGNADRPIFRYDNTDAKSGHANAHHKHRFDPMTWQGSRLRYGSAKHGWPHLSDVVEELRDWWETTGRHLGLAAPSRDDE